MDAATDWRISFPPVNRQYLVCMIMETLKSCFPNPGPEGLIKLRKMAEWYEEESYTDAKNKSHYIRKIEMKMLNMETIFQITGMPNTIQSNPAGSTQNPLAPGRPKCFWDIRDAATDQRISLQPDNRQNLVNMIMETLKNCFPDSGPERLAKLNKMAEWYEEESYIAATNKSDYLQKISLKILNVERIFLTTGMPNTIQSKSAGSTQNPLAPVELFNAVAAAAMVQQHHPDNPMQPTNMQKSVSSKQSTAVTITCHASTDSKAQKGQNAVDWQEETYQNIQSMKKKYLPSLNDMYQQITINCQQSDSLPNVPKSKESEKGIKKALETAMKFLNESKDNTIPLEKERLAAYEKAILLILSKGPWKPASEQQQQPQQQQQEVQQQQQQQEAQQQPQQQQQQAHSSNNKKRSSSSNNKDISNKKHNSQQ